jgi:ubiquinone/menaquinone biosynthesis C-methylase UbiE
MKNKRGVNMCVKKADDKIMNNSLQHNNLPPPPPPPCVHGDSRVWYAAHGKDLFINSVRCFLQKRCLLKLLRQSKNKTLVDVGCGYHAFFLQACKDKFGSLIGIDYSVNTDSLEKMGIEYRQGDALSVLSGMQNASVDAITFFSIMEHINTQVELLKECRRILKDDGIVYVNSPSWFGKIILEDVIIRFFDRKKKYAEQVDTHCTYFSISKMWQYLRDAGFVSSEIKVWHSNFFCSITGYARKIRKD